MNIPAEAGQVWASTNRDDVARGHNQRRAVLALTEKKLYRGYDNEMRRSIYATRPAVVLTCEGNGGKMRSVVTLRDDGTIPGHVLVAEPDPRIKTLAEAFRGIIERPPFAGAYDEAYAAMPENHKDLGDMVYEALLWPRQAGGAQNPRIEVVLHQDALAQIAARIVELGMVVEQGALAATVGYEHYLMPAEREALDYENPSEPSGDVHTGTLPGEHEFDVMEP